MSLNPSSCASAIWTFMQGAIEVDEDGVPTGDRNFASPADHAQAFANAYHDYASAGVVLGAASGGGDKSILENAWGKSTTPADLGTALANYWATVAVSPGTPAHGGIAVAAVVNNASALTASFIAAVQASITDSKSTPFYFNLVSNVESTAVKTIIWTVTETMPGPPPYPATFPEPIA